MTSRSILFGAKAYFIDDLEFYGRIQENDTHGTLCEISKVDSTFNIALLLAIQAILQYHDPLDCSTFLLANNSRNSLSCRG